MKIVIFSPHIPHEEVAHAGGQYFLRHLRVLERLGHSVTVVAPDWPENRVGRLALQARFEVILVDTGGSRLLGPLDRFNRQVRVSSPQERLARNWASNEKVHESVAHADLLELQWTQSAVLYHKIQKRLPRHPPSLLIAHDVLTQKYYRELIAARRLSIDYWVALARYLLARRDERLGVRAVSAVATLSSKDQRQLQQWLRAGEANFVLTPPFDLPRLESPRDSSPGATVIMVAAFGRPENDQAAQWLLESVWPEVRRAVPGARILFVGDRPSQALLDRSATDSSVVVTGFVESVDPYYRAASLVVVPLLQGAGIKFKTVWAMLWCVPVVTTSIGAEGIAPEGQERELFVVADHPHEFASAICSSLVSDRASFIARAQRARSYAAHHFAKDDYDQRLSEAYERVVREFRSTGR